MGTQIRGEVFKHLPRRDNKIITEDWPRIEGTQIVTMFNGMPHYEYECRWIGSKYAIVTVSKLLHNQTGLSIYPWPLKILDEDIDFGRCMSVVRKDVGWHLWWILVSIWYKLFRSRQYGHFKWRVIKTFELWGIGYQPEGEELSWKSIRRKHETKKNIL